MDALMLHGHTKMQLKALLVNTPHAVLLIGDNGIGKLTVAKAWASSLTSPAGITILEPDEKGTISIDAIRSLYQRTRSKQEEWQVVIIDHAEALGIEAQNAFLKLLEEPRHGVTFVLTAPNADALLPTILSRTQHVRVQKVGSDTLRTLIPPEVTPADQAKLLFMAAGRPATLTALLSDPALFARHSELMQKAKRLLTSSHYERLCTVQELTKNKQELVFVLEATADMLGMQLARDPSRRNIAFEAALNDCLARLAQNGNPRAQLTYLFSSSYLV